ncbi:hypothetical protein EJB05_13320, partial [Eragrostis curvula]
MHQWRRTISHRPTRARRPPPGAGARRDVTVLHTDFNDPDPARHPEFTFVSIRESLPRDVIDNAGMVEQMMGLNAACETPFQAALEEVLHLQGHRARSAPWWSPPTRRAVVRHAGRGQARGRRRHVPQHGMLATPRLRDAGYVPVREERLDEAVPRLEPLRVRDLIRRATTDETRCSGSSAAGVVVNTFDAIGGPELAPLPSFGGGGARPARAGPRLPVVAGHVSLGSVARVDHAVFQEIAARGLPPAASHSSGFSAPASCATLATSRGRHRCCRRRTKGRSWRQREVLAYLSVGGFWTHCGRNSMMETIYAGVPVLTQPCFADQTVSARYVTHRWPGCWASGGGDDGWTGRTSRMPLEG